MQTCQVTRIERVCDTRILIRLPALPPAFNYHSPECSLINLLEKHILFRKQHRRNVFTGIIGMSKQCFIALKRVGGWGLAQVPNVSPTSPPFEREAPLRRAWEQENGSIGDHPQLAL